MLKQILLGLFIAGLGGAMIFYSPALMDMFGRVARFEKNLGGTRAGYVLIGFAIIVVGFLILFGVIPLNPATSTVSSGLGTGA